MYEDMTSFSQSLGALLRVLLFGSTWAVSCVLAANPTVTVNEGVAVGKQTTVPGASVAVNEFLGLPFAAAPVDDLRFAPPQDPPSWQGTRSAAAFKPACWQQVTQNLSSPATYIFANPLAYESEDCLYLNVFAPDGSTQSSRLPVLFWLYGGNLAYGNAGQPQYDGSYFAAHQDVLVVTINYRTNVFGFPGSPAISLPENNVGYLDQRKALAWVQKNIYAFGGDPAKVTIFGESAGGYSVKQLLAHPPHPLPFRGAIIESQGLSLSDSVQSWNSLVKSLGCQSKGVPSNSTSRVELACVRKAPAADIAGIVLNQSLGFSPIDDGRTQSSDISGFIVNRTFTNVPFIIGTNADEANVFLGLLGLYEPGANLLSALQKFAGPLYPLLQPVVSAILSTSKKAVLPTVSKILTELAWQCRTKYIGNVAVDHGYQVWRYYFNGSFPNQSPLYKDLGAYHSSEIYEVFGTYNKTYPTAQQVALSKYMQKVWADFAKDPSSGPGWTPYSSDPSEASIGDLGGGGSFGEYDVTQNDVDTYCALLKPLIMLGGL